MLDIRWIREYEAKTGRRVIRELTFEPKIGLGLDATDWGSCQEEYEDYYDAEEAIGDMNDKKI